MEKQRLLIAGISEKERKTLAHAFLGLENIEVVAALDDGAAVVRTIYRERIDILIMDPMLKQIDGLHAMELLYRLPDERRPLLFLLSPFSDDRLLKPWQELAAYCFIKPYCLESVVLRVLQLCVNDAAPEAAYAPFHLQNATLLERNITKALLSIGVPAHHRGYHMMRDAIRMYAQSDNPIDLRITLDVYPRLGEIHDCHAKEVEHAIRTSIEYAWVHGNLNAIHAYFGYTIDDTRGKPSNAEFIMRMAEHVRLKPTRGFMKMR